MKKEGHPKYNKITATCACGAEFLTGSVNKEIRVDICSQCHPFFTGKQKLVDSTGAVDKFRKRQEQKKALSAKSAKK
jgi:large subunit ribosomal protein L31